MQGNETHKNNSKMKAKHKLLFVLVFFASQTLLAQETEPALAKVHYQFVHVNDTTQRDKHRQEEMVLYLGQHASFYGSYAGKRMEEEVKKQIEDPGFDGNIVIKGSSSGSRESYYTVSSKKQMQQIYQLSGDSYLLEEQFPKLDWKIREETKEIGGYLCQKAEVHFKGRDYIAWFTSEIPFQAGPWKLNGLPGLIMEASDSKKEVFFNYAGFDKMDEGNFIVGIPENTIKTNKKALNNLLEAYKKNPVAAMKARSQSGGGSRRSSPLDKYDVSMIKNITVEKASSAHESPNTNNPIEL